MFFLWQQQNSKGPSNKSVQSCTMFERNYKTLEDTWEVKIFEKKFSFTSMSIFLQIYRFNTLPKKIPVDFFKNCGKINIT